MAAAKNQVTLTLAGDSAQLEQAFARTGQAAKGLSDNVGEANHSFEAAREGFDKAEQRAMGFRDTITGVQDSVGGLSKVLKGDFSGDALFQAGAGIGDLASGFANLLIPALGAAVTSFKALTVAMLTSPITWIVVGLALLVGAFILLWNKSEAFRNFWKGLWAGIKDIAGGVVDWFEKLPGRIGGFFSAIGEFIKVAFKTAFNYVADFWNNTIGKLQWDVPSWVPLIGGNHIGAPLIPKFHTGGVVPGAPGQEMLAVLQAGEQVTPAGSSSARSLGPADLRGVGGSGFDRLMLEYLSELLRANNLRLVSA